jgi:general secretion pathway protein O
MNTWPLLFFFLLAYGFQLAALSMADRFIALQDGHSSLSFKGYYLIIIPLFSVLAVSRIPEETTLTVLLFRAAFYGFLLLFIVCDSERHWLPRCFTLAFFVTGMACQLLLQPSRVWLAVLAAAALWTGLVIFRTCVNRRSNADVFGLGDVYLIAGLTAWFSVSAVLEIISVAAGLAMLLLWVKKHRSPSRWRHHQEYRGVPFAPFLCGVTAVHALFSGSFF